VGQSSEQVAEYLRAIARAVPDATVQAVDILAAKRGSPMQGAAVALFRQHGPAALPIACNETQVLAFGALDPEQLAKQVAARLTGASEEKR